MSRLHDWITREMQGCDSEYELAAGIDNGDIDTPDWLRYNPGNDTLYDADESDGRLGLYYLDTTPLTEE